ncbi:ATPase [Acuticoccus sediminis]|uniref:ATPase n=1 Tax=Acuticoccus sediminis TaxID=2184697 RepID=A0A8B2NN56_9HYPH|nr:AAA family ATPase [Acuticoccus sediminis]RAH99317.1 ATPase [Acuticoccus sediminis]
MTCRVVISGCSGGGKSTLLEALAARGYATVEEPGRRIVREALASDGGTLPWRDPVAFAHRAIAMAQDDHARVDGLGPLVFFDRGLVDAASFLDHVTDGDALSGLASATRYHTTVFLTPPWPELFQNDAERRHGFGEAISEYARLAQAYPAAGYTVVTLPRVSVKERVGIVLAELDAPQFAEP